MYTMFYFQTNQILSNNLDYQRCFVRILISMKSRVVYSMQLMTGECVEYIYPVTQIILFITTRFPYQMMLLSFNSHMTAVTSGTGTSNPSGASEFTPSLQWSTCSSIFNFLCSVLWTIICLFVFFFWTLYCLSLFASLAFTVECVDCECLTFKLFTEWDIGFHSIHNPTLKQIRNKHQLYCVQFRWTVSVV